MTYRDKREAEVQGEWRPSTGKALAAKAQSRQVKVDADECDSEEVSLQVEADADEFDTVVRYKRHKAFMALIAAAVRRAEAEDRLELALRFLR